MSNPRPCVCGHPESEHTFTGWHLCSLCVCARYRGVPRKEPLRADQVPDTLAWGRARLDALASHRQRLRDSGSVPRLCPHGRPGVVNMVDFIGFGPFVESVPGRVECPPECHAT